LYFYSMLYVPMDLFRPHLMMIFKGDPMPHLIYGIIGQVTIRGSMPT